MLPTILVSSVIRSTHRGNSHGGIYKINLETEQIDQMLDWDNPDINWEGRGGDRGIRGLSIFGNELYAVAGNELFSFKEVNNNLEIVNKFKNDYLKLTHECYGFEEKLYICSGGTDSILVFDLLAKEWVTSFYHNKISQGARPFNPITKKGYENITGGFMHLDSVFANHEYLWYCGAFTKSIWQLNLNTGQTSNVELIIPDTHNARPYRGGYLYNLSRFSKTVFEYGGKIKKTWRTPIFNEKELSNTHLSKDHAVQGYTRGMLTYNNYIITGSSPAAVNVYLFDDTKQPVKTVRLTNDIRNSICGMTFYIW